MDQLIEAAKETIERLRRERPGRSNLEYATDAISANHDAHIALVAAGMMHRSEL